MPKHCLSSPHPRDLTHPPGCWRLLPLCAAQTCPRGLQTVTAPGDGWGPPPPPATCTSGQQQEVTHSSRTAPALSTGFLPPQAWPLESLSDPARKWPRASPDQQTLPKAAKHLLTGQGLRERVPRSPSSRQEAPSQSTGTEVGLLFLPGCVALDNSPNLSVPRFLICWTE